MRIELGEGGLGEVPAVSVKGSWEYYFGKGEIFILPQLFMKIVYEKYVGQEKYNTDMVVFQKKIYGIYYCPFNFV